MIRSHRSLVTAALAVSAVLAPRSADAQPRYFARLSVSRTELRPPRPQFTIAPTSVATGAIGLVVAERHAIELSMSGTRVETTEPPVGGGDTPYTVGIRASTIEFGYVYRAPVLWELLEPRLGVGVRRSHIVDCWQSDTQPEYARGTEYGITPSLGFALHLPGPLAAVVRGSYGYSRAAVSPLRIGVDGLRFELGLETWYAKRAR